MTVSEHNGASPPASCFHLPNTSLILLLNVFGIYLLLCVFVYVLCKWMYRYVYSLEVSVGFLLLVSTLFFETGFLLEPVAH